VLEYSVLVFGIRQNWVIPCWNVQDWRIPASDSVIIFYVFFFFFFAFLSFLQTELFHNIPLPMSYNLFIYLEFCNLRVDMKMIPTCKWNSGMMIDLIFHPNCFLCEKPRAGATLSLA
jgi:hypothetical protein